MSFGLRKLPLVLGVSAWSVLTLGHPAWAQDHAPLEYRGGPVLRNFTIYPLYYGKWDSGDIKTHHDYLKNLVGYLSGQNAPANQQPMLRQYGVTGATASAALQARADLIPKPGQRLRLTDQDILDIIHTNQDSRKLPSYSSTALIMVFLWRVSTWTQDIPVGTTIMNRHRPFGRPSSKIVAQL